jgi:C4-dicarboxylate-specific signal transduction histidine kinase
MAVSMTPTRRSNRGRHAHAHGALTGHLKTFARKSPSGLRERLDLATVVDQSLQLLDARLRDEQVSLVLHLTRPAWVRGDAIRLEQVLINLLRNALDAMQANRASAWKSASRPTNNCGA